MHVMESECEKSSDVAAQSVLEVVPESSEKLLSNGIVANKPKETREPNPEEDIEEDVDEAVCERENGGAITNVVVNGENEDSDEREAKVTGKSAERIEESVERIEECGEVLSVAKEMSLGDKEPTKEDTKHQKEEGVCSEEEDRNSISSSQGVENNRKRRTVRGSAGEGGDGSSSDTDSSPSANKRPRSSRRDSIDERERLVQDYVESCAGSVEEMSRVAEKLSREIGALAELARTKELEWNSILRLRKLKEEMLERLYRRKRQTMFLTDNGLHNEWSMSIEPKMMVGAKCSNGLGPNSGAGGQLVFVPVSPPPGYNSLSITSSRDVRAPDSTNARLHRPILPKPSQSFLDQQNTVIGEGRQGPILDVKSIIADYRSRHPESVPRRGRRLKQPLGTGAGGGTVVSSTRITGSPALMSMANMALGSGGGAHVRIMPHDAAPFSLGGHDNNSRPSSSDSSRSTELPSPNISFKDVLVQFAKMKQPPLPPPPPPYPEVTLHPVTGPPSPPPAPHTSLLHGILTKSHHRPTTFSPTLARLLTAPERPVPPSTTTTAITATTTSQFRPPAKRVSISDLLTSSKKSRNEITITPVSELSPIAKPKDEVVLLDDEDELDSADRLVIDESRDTGTLPADEVPQCQGCHLQSAQFVCAGCGNQWYCSRDCQVLAWEEHSEVCSG